MDLLCLLSRSLAIRAGVIIMENVRIGKELSPRMYANDRELGTVN